jgi:hypothetical protein
VGQQDNRTAGQQPLQQEQHNQWNNKTTVLEQPGSTTKQWSSTAAATCKMQPGNGRYGLQQQLQRYSNCYSNAATHTAAQRHGNTVQQHSSTPAQQHNSTAGQPAWQAQQQQHNSNSSTAQQ